MLSPPSSYLTVMFLLASCYLGGQPVVLPDRAEPVLVDRFEVLSDSSFSLTDQAVLAARNLTQLNGSPMQLPAGAVYWVRFAVKHQSTDRRYYLEVTASDFYDVRLVLPESSGASAQRLSFNKQKVIYTLDIPPGEVVPVFLYLDRRYLPVTCRVKLMTEAGFPLERSKIAFAGGLYTGAGILYLLFALLLVVSFRNRESLYYAIYVLGGMCYLFYSRAEPLGGLLDGLGIGYLFDTLPYASIAVSTIGHLGLFYTFFRLEKRPYWYRLVRGMQVVAVGLFVVLLCWPYLVAWRFDAYLWAVKAVALVSMVTMLLILLGGPYLLLRGGDREQRLFLLTFAPILLLVVYIWLAEARVLPRLDLVYDNAPGLMIFYEGTVLGGLLVYRYFRERLRLLTTLRNERREIIHDLHSGLLPEMDALRELNQRAIRPLGDEVSEQVERLNSEMTEDVRLLMWTLNRTQGEDLDELVGRLREKVYARFAGLPARATFVTEPTVIPEGIPVSFSLSYHLLHFVKEVTNNAAKHAHCSQLTGLLEVQRGQLFLALEDDGCGFAYDPTLSEIGFGLGELHQRAEKMRGVFSCESVPGRGTRVELVVPIEVPLMR